MSDRFFCGCCGGPVAPGAVFCVPCLPHLAPEDRVPWERTYLAQHGVDCPWQVGRGK